MRTIDADALIHELNNSHYPGAPYIDAGISIAIGKVCDAPTIEPERKTGYWILADAYGGRKRWRCSECYAFALKTDDGRENLSDYCPVCGARLGGEDDGTD